eukprot:7264665-Prorocentrum_lima.AAC.1
MHSSKLVCSIWPPVVSYHRFLDKRGSPPSLECALACNAVPKPLPFQLCSYHLLSPCTWHLK